MKEAFKGLKGGTSPGVDGQTLAMYEENLEDNLQDLLQRAKSGSYIAPPVKRVYIPKGNGREQRPIGIPTVEDRIMQRAVLQVLDPVFEQDFFDFSYGFRRGKSQHDAVDYLWKQIYQQNIGWVIDLDIRKFFDTMNHQHLRRFLRQRVCDGVITRLIGKWLKAGILEEGSISYRDEGSPQGGVISPLLSNIYLHEVLDKWFANEIIPLLKGRAIIVRFADDCVLGFECQADAERVFKVLPKRFAKFGLQLHPDKTQLIPFSKPPQVSKQGTGKRCSFNFLGFTFYWGKSRKGHWIVMRKTAKDRLQRSISRINHWCKLHRHDSYTYQHKMLNAKLRGHYYYYGVTGNSRSLKAFYRLVTLCWKKWLSRRTNRNLTWVRFISLISSKFALAKPKIYHSIYAAKP
ncbi:MAG: group II intron reverse transcriptase/maturase [Lentimicrobium sp.]|nr:group II intron reverse transcriptase/maturase [Lentimicrobium sp.]